jgi:serine protease Do
MIQIQHTGTTATPTRWPSLLAAMVVSAAMVTSLTVVPSAQAATGSSQAAPLLVQGLPDFTSLVEAVGPSVVNIRTTEKVKAQRAGPGLDPNMLEFFKRFGVPIPPGLGEGQPQEPGGHESRPHGIGSGFVLSADGYILTNAHVVDGADELIVTLPDKREFKGKVVGEDRRTDVALVKIDANNLAPVQVGDAQALKVGEWVMAIGSPYGLANTVTAGIVSAKQRETGDYLPFIQTDVAINPGNSGGPLINMRGQVVGINSQIYSRSGGFQGISFAIPIDEAVRVSKQLQAQGFVTRGRIGVAIDDVTKEVAEGVGLDKPRGALVRGVENGSPAAKAGLEPGDVILSFDGKTIEQTPDLPRVVGNTKPGTRSAIVVWRDKKEVNLKITVGEFKRAEKQASKTGQATPDQSTVIESVGLKVRGLNRDELKEKNVPHGVLIEGVSGLAANAGLEAGDVLLGVANRKIHTVQELATVLTQLKKAKTISVLYQRGEWVQYGMIRR